MKDENQTNKAILKALFVNMNYAPGESVLIVSQSWDTGLGHETKERFEASQKLARRMFEVISGHCKSVRFLEYTPSKTQNGVDAPSEMYEKAGKPAVVFMPTAFSLTHTPFRVHLSNLEARVATMPGLKLDAFEENGPMDIDYKLIEANTAAIADKMKKSRYARITAEGTDIVIELDSNTADTSAGMIAEKGSCGNLPGAEAYVVPIHLGNSDGYFSVPRGWGGTFPLEYPARFYVRGGRFIDVVAKDSLAQEYIDKKIKPGLLEPFGAGKDFDVLAEFGVGTNPNVTEKYIHERGWSTLLAEKIIGSAHLANGNSRYLGGKNDVRIHQDWVIPNAHIEWDYKR